MLKMLRSPVFVLALAASLVLRVDLAGGQGTIKIAYTDPLSGPFAQVGDQNLKQFKYILDWINSRGGALGKKFEIVAFDNKSQPSEAIIALKSATDQNMPIIMQCSGSNIAAALIPLGKVKDFSPYVTKIKASGAQALITGNWGPDMSLLIKAGMDTGLEVRYYTMYAHLGGGATAIGPNGSGRVRSVMAFHENIAVETHKADTEEWTRAFRGQHNFDFYAAGFRTIFEFIQAAMNKAGSTDPLKFAQALEGMTITDMLGYQVTMRKDDHQILSEYFVGVFTKGVKYDSEGTGLGWKTEVTVPAKHLPHPPTSRST